MFSSSIQYRVGLDVFLLDTVAYLDYLLSRDRISIEHWKHVLPCAAGYPPFGFTVVVFKLKSCFDRIFNDRLTSRELIRW
jgi:glucose uptake protein GlcU